MNILAYSGISRSIMSVILAVISFFSVLFGHPAFPYKRSIDMSGYTLQWADEFDGTELDRTKWKYHGWDELDGNGTYMRKGGYWNKELISFNDGALHISTRYYENGLNDNGYAGWYSSAIDTMGLYETSNGYFECRCILPKGAGLWSAFWIYDGEVGNIGNGGVDGAELDIFESAYYWNEKDRNSVSSAIHYDGYDEYHKIETVHQTYITANNPYEEYNTYGLEWNEDEYIFYINGVEVGRTSFGGICTADEALLLSVEIGGKNGTPDESWAGPSIETNEEAPTDFIVDYVRVYKK